MRQAAGGGLGGPGSDLEARIMAKTLPLVQYLFDPQPLVACVAPTLHWRQGSRLNALVSIRRQNCS